MPSDAEWYGLLAPIAAACLAFGGKKFREWLGRPTPAADSPPPPATGVPNGVTASAEDRARTVLQRSFDQMAGRVDRMVSDMDSFQAQLEEADKAITTLRSEIALLRKQLDAAQLYIASFQQSLALEAVETAERITARIHIKYPPAA